MPENAGPRLPGNSDRLVELGRTGTGKTVAGLWHLSNFDLDRRPWVAIDFKRDKHLNSIENAQYIDWDYIPHKKDDGLFIIHALPWDADGSAKQRATVDEYLIKIWERENCGLFIDEAYAIGDCDGMNLCLTQGRSKEIPMIICSQRPVWVSRFTWSEASFVQCFALTDVDDRERVGDFTAIDFDNSLPLQKHHSFYYDVSEDELFRLRPVPNMDEIRERFENKLRRKFARI